MIFDLPYVFWWVKWNQKTPKKKAKEKKSNIFDDDWDERCSECDEYYEDCECEDCPDDDCRNEGGGR